MAYKIRERRASEKGRPNCISLLFIFAHQQAKRACIIRDVSGIAHLVLENRNLGIGGVCRVNKTQTKQLLLVVN